MASRFTERLKAPSENPNTHHKLEHEALCLSAKRALRQPRKFAQGVGF